MGLVQKAHEARDLTGREGGTRGAESAQLERVEGPLPESQDQKLTLTFLCDPALEMPPPTILPAPIHTVVLSMSLCPHSSLYLALSLPLSPSISLSLYLSLFPFPPLPTPVSICALHCPRQCPSGEQSREGPLPSETATTLKVSRTFT